MPKGTTCSFRSPSSEPAKGLIFIGLFETLTSVRWFRIWQSSSIAVVAFGMKDAHYMQDIPEVPLSPDPRVTRRYDLGLNRQLPEITFFSLSEDLINDCNGKVHTELGGERN